MKKLICTCIILSTIFVANAQNYPQYFTENKTCSKAFDSLRLQRIDSAYQRLIDEGLLPHAITFVAHKGEIVHYKAFGWRDYEKKIPCKRDDIFRMASQSKAIAVVALMTLFEEGRFQLDQPIKQYIPEFANPQVLENYNAADTSYTTRAASRDITIRDLITHTSGIAGYDGVFSAIYEKNGISTFNLQGDFTIEDATKCLAKLPLAHNPGEQFTYGMSTDILGYLIEVISGQSLDVFIKERVLDSLGMKDTYFFLPDNKAERLVTLYRFSKERLLQPLDNSIYQNFPIEGAKKFFSAGAGLCGTIEDYAKFCQMILNNGEFNGVRILGRKTLEMMRHNGVANLRGEIGFGMAWDVFTPEYAHRSIVSIGSSRWGGMFGTDYIIDPTEDLIVLVYTNVYPNLTGINPKTLMHNVTYQALK